MPHSLWVGLDKQIKFCKLLIAQFDLHRFLPTHQSSTSFPKFFFLFAEFEKLSFFLSSPLIKGTLSRSFFHDAADGARQIECLRCHWHCETICETSSAGGVESWKRGLKQSRDIVPLSAAMFSVNIRILSLYGVFDVLSRHHPDYVTILSLWRIVSSSSVNSHYIEFGQGRRCCLGTKSI